jgi:hypothetical protein
MVTVVPIAPESGDSSSSGAATAGVPVSPTNPQAKKITTAMRKILPYFIGLASSSLPEFLSRSPSLYQPFSGPALWNIGSGKIIQNIPANQPRIMNLNRRYISLSAQPFNRLRMNLETPAGFYYIIIIIKRCHNIKYYFVKTIIIQVKIFCQPSSYFFIQICLQYKRGGHGVVPDFAAFPGHFHELPC